MQCRAYGAAKARSGGWTSELLHFHDGTGGEPIAACQVLVKQLRLPLISTGLAWINRGPCLIGAAQDPDLYNACLDALFRYFVSERKFYLRLAPASMVEHLPSAFLRTQVPGWQSATVSLETDTDTLRAALKQKWRNTLNKAEKAGIDVQSGSQPERIYAFIADHEAFVERAGFRTTVTSELMRSLANADDPNFSLTAFSAHDVRGETLGWALVAIYGSTAEYLAGNSTDTGRKAGAGQILLWRAMVDMKARGLRWFDVGGMDLNLTPPGIFRFKEGLSGQPYALPNEIEALPTGLVAGPLGRLIRYRVQRALSSR